jgi:mannose-1-phosphate guanylyltransferase/phosphomannomutase
MMLKRGDPIYGYASDGYWCDVGNLGEYIRANADALNGIVKLKIPGRNIGGDVWVEEGVEIADDAHIFGPIYLGPSVRVLKGTHINGPCSISSYSIIDSNASIDRSIIWENTYIGSFCELRGALVGAHTSMKSRSVLFEGSVVGDNCRIDEAAVIQPNVKIWPKKEIENGAVITDSIVWGNQGRKTLFGRLGITGLVNIDITPDLAAKIGAAYGAVLKKGAIVCVNRDAHRTPRMIKRAIIAGLPSSGVDVSDLRAVPLPVARHFIRTTDAAGGIHVRLSPFDPRTIDIRFFDGQGMDISKTLERKIENLYFREDFRRVYLDEIGQIDYAPNVIERYTNAFLKAIDVNVIRNRHFTIVVDYSNGGSVQILAQILNSLGCEVIALNSSMDEQRFSRSADQFEQDCQRMADITQTLKADLGVRLDTAGEKLFVADATGQVLDSNEFLSIMAELILRANQGATVVVPSVATGAIEAITTRLKGQVRRVGATPDVLSNASLRDGVVMVGDSVGGFIFPSLHPAFDGMFALAKFLELLARFDVRLPDLVRNLPPYFQLNKQVECKWEHKGRVMRLLSENYRDSQSPDGVRIQSGNNDWVLIWPDADRPIFTIMAEARSREQAQALVDRYARIVSSFQQ